MASRPVRPSTPSDSTSDSAVSSTSVDIAAPVTATSSSVDASETQTTSTPTLAATPAATSSPSEAQATFLYPVGSPTFNSIDAVDFSYQSSWTAANLTVFCTVNPGSGTLTSYEIDQIHSGDIYLLKPILGNLNVQQYPAACHMMLMDAKDGSLVVNGGQFTMTNTQGIASTYARTITAAAASITESQKTPTLLPASQVTTTNSAIDGTDASATSAANGSQGYGSLTTSQTSTSSTNIAGTSEKSSGSPSGLTAGAKAGIAVGVILALLALIGCLFLFIRRRRSRENNGERLTSTRGNSPSASAPETPRKVVSEPTTASMPKIVQMGSATSAEWQKFFENKPLAKGTMEKEVA